MIAVYFETENGSYAEEVATFKNDELYMKCLPILEREAKEHRMIVTESEISTAYTQEKLANIKEK